MSNCNVQTPGKSGFTFELNKGEITIGRELKNELILDDPRVSRHHAIVRETPEGWILRDLESGNGTYLNGQRVPPNVDVKLSDRDLVRLGASTLTLELVNNKLKESYSTGIITDNFRQVLEKTPNELLTTSAVGGANTSREVSPSFYRRELEKKERVLKLFYELSQKLGQVFLLEDIYQQVFEILMEVTPASRAFIFRRNEQGAFEQVASRQREGKEAGEPLPISKTIFAKVASERVSVLLEDAQQSDKAATPISIVVSQVCSVMAAPIIGPRGLLGIIYADRHDVYETFSGDDLDLLNAVAVQTGIAINTVINYERLQKQAQARAQLVRFMPHQVVEEILRAPDQIKLGGTRQMVTALFADVRNFTPLSENVAPELIVKLLNLYFSLVSEIIFKYGGTLDKYIGDGLLALFGAPYVRVLDAVQAVRAAIEIQRAMAGFNDRLRQENLPAIAVGIGINTGPAIVGYIGSETRLDYTAIGDTINTAARLENIAKPGQIVVSENTMQVLEEDFLLQPLGTMKLKGRLASMKTAEVVWQ